jgi:peptidylprolyl isomerase
MKYVLIEEGSGEKPSTGTTIHARFSGRTLDGTKVFQSDEDGRPGPHKEAVLFDYTIGETSLIPAIDEALADMRPGEKRLLIVPSSLGYGRGGFYSRQIEGQKRFVISPNTTLVIELTFTEDEPR